MEREEVVVTADEVACAIVASRGHKKSMKAFFEALTAPGPKEKHAGWTRVCENIRQAKSMSMMSKAWRREVHAYFVDNLAEIEQLVWGKIMQLPVDVDDTEDVIACLNDALHYVPSPDKPSLRKKTHRN